MMKMLHFVLLAVFSKCFSLKFLFLGFDGRYLSRTRSANVDCLPVAYCIEFLKFGQLTCYCSFQGLCDLVYLIMDLVSFCVGCGYGDCTGGRITSREDVCHQGSSRGEFPDLQA